MNYSQSTNAFCFPLISILSWFNPFHSVPQHFFALFYANMWATGPWSRADPLKLAVERMLKKILC